MGFFTNSYFLILLLNCNLTWTHQWQCLASLWGSLNNDKSVRLKVPERRANCLLLFHIVENDVDTCVIL